MIPDSKDMAIVLALCAGICELSCAKPVRLPRAYVRAFFAAPMATDATCGTGFRDGTKSSRAPEVVPDLSDFMALHPEPVVPHDDPAEIDRQCREADAQAASK